MNLKDFDLATFKIDKAKLLGDIKMPEPLLVAKISTAEIKAMSAEDIKAILTGEKELDGILSIALQNALTIELSERAIKEASRPHWSTTYNFWVTVIAATASCLAVGLTIYQIRSSQPAPVVPKVAAPTPSVHSIDSSLRKHLLHKQP